MNTSVSAKFSDYSKIVHNSFDFARLNLKRLALGFKLFKLGTYLYSIWARNE